MILLFVVGHYDCILTSDLFSQSHQRFDLGLSEGFLDCDGAVLLDREGVLLGLGGLAADQLLGEAGAPAAREVAAGIVVVLGERSLVGLVVAAGAGGVAGLGAGAAVAVGGSGDHQRSGRLVVAVAVGPAERGITDMPLDHDRRLLQDRAELLGDRRPTAATSGSGSRGGRGRSREGSVQRQRGILVGAARAGRVVRGRQCSRVRAALRKRAGRGARIVDMGINGGHLEGVVIWSDVSVI